MPRAEAAVSILRHFMGFAMAFGVGVFLQLTTTQEGSPFRRERSVCHRRGWRNGDADQVVERRGFGHRFRHRIAGIRKSLPPGYAGLYANDEAASFDIDDPVSPGFGQSAQTFVGRVRYDLYSESFIGAVFTDREFLNGSSRLAGIDSNFRVGNTHQLGFRALRTDHQEELDALQTDGYMMDFGFRKRGRNLNYSIDAFSLSPDFKTDVGFVRRTDMRRYDGSVGYQWWPQTWLISWGPEARYGQNYNFDKVLEDENGSVQLSANFAKNIRYNFTVNQDMERYEGINFDKQRYSMFGIRLNARPGGGLRWSRSSAPTRDSPLTYG